MKVLFLSIGTRGDMEPFLAMAELFRNNEWEVACAMPEQFRDMISQRDIPFRPFDRRFMDLIDSDDGHKIMGQQGSIPARIAALIRISRKSLSLQGVLIREQYEIIKEEQPDLVVYHGKCVYPIIWGIQNPGKTIMMSAMPCLVHPVSTHPNIGMKFDLGPRFNLWTYRFVNSILAITTKRSARHLPKSAINKSQISRRDIKQFLVHKQAYFYSFSPAIFKRPANWPDHVKITGFRELPKAEDYAPPLELTSFLEQHRKILFVSFGSMVNNDPPGKTRAIVNLLVKHDIPAIINTSWGGLEELADIPDHLLFVKNIPYDWLFPRVYAVVHHGGSGTTHTGLKFGCPSLIVPHILDQFFWGKTITELGLGPQSIPIKRLSENRLEPYLIDLWTNASYKQKAESIAWQMQKEDFAEEILKTAEEMLSVSHLTT